MRCGAATVASSVAVRRPISRKPETIRKNVMRVDTGHAAATRASLRLWRRRIKA
jgi:hypothetical protein